MTHDCAAVSNPRSTAEPGNRGADAVPAMTDATAAMFQLRLAQINRRQQRFDGRRQLWLAHHWPEHYGQRCVRVGKRHVCRRCAALYPLGFFVALLAAFGHPPWPASFDPAAIWILSVPATVAFVGEAIGLFRYAPRWQVATTLMAAVAFGRALGYELVDRWSPEFWQPIAVFGGIWFFASAFNAGTTRKHTGVRPTATRPPGPEANRAPVQ